MMDASGHSRGRTWTTKLVKPTERFSYYREAICQAFMRMTPEQPNSPGFSASGESVPLGRGALNKVIFPAHSTTRSKADIAASDRRCFYLNFRIAGRSQVQQAGLDICLSPGQVCIIDSDRTFSLIHHPAPSISVASFFVPAESLSDRLGASFDVKPSRLSDDPHLGPLIIETARSLDSNALRMQPDEAARLFEVLLDLVAIQMSRQTDPSVIESTSVSNATTLAIKIAIEEKLNQPGLTVADVAASVGVSERYVHMLLARTGTTFRDYVMQRRLDGIAADLRDSTLVALDIGTIALEWGFADLSHFSRRFKERFGMRPRDWRAI